MKKDNRISDIDRNAGLSKDNDAKKNKRTRRYPESSMTKDQRKDAEAATKNSDVEALTGDVNGTVGSRATSDHPEDIAGVADLDQGMRRAKKS